MSKPVVEFQKVCKNYQTGLLRRRAIHALREVSFAVPRGCVFGLLGPNRAGKTTLVKALLSICRPNSGTVLRLGRDASDRSTLARVGYVHESPAFPRYLTARALLDYYGGLSLLSRRELTERIPRLLDEVGLADRASEPIAVYSKGMLQRLALAQALINEPELLVLDEPTEGMDLSARKLFHQVILRCKQAGKTTLLVSHNMADVGRLCDEAAVIRGGQVVVRGALADLAGQPRPASGCPGIEADALQEALETIYAGDDCPDSFVLGQRACVPVECEDGPVTLAGAQL
jgi:ABC-2 type transport system ATP-binding protein